MRPAPALALALLMVTIGSGIAQVRYFGKELGALSALQHGVRGSVHAVDSRTLYIHNFHYDGEGPAAYFYVGTSGSPRTGAGSVRLRDERGGSSPLRKYNGESITLSLPDGKTLRDFRWFSVYCDEYEVNFGDVAIPRSLDYPRPAKVGALRGVHGVSSDPIVVVDAQTILVPNFSYDGEAPAAYFYVGTSGSPRTGAGSVRLRDERGGSSPLRKYNGESITLSLPDGKTLRDFRWFSVYCDEYEVNFGDVAIPRSLDYPRPAKVGALRGVHGVSSDPIVVVDAQTILVPNFSYDGEAPDAKFWVGRGDKPSPQGIRIADENGKETPLRRYDKKTIVLTLPGELTVFDIGHFSVWCEAFTVNFGHVTLPRSSLANVPPSLKMLGVSPQSKLNCEVLYDELAFEVRWAVAGDSIVLQLVAKLEDGEYMSFGLSGDPKRSQMVGGDVAVAWVDKSTMKGYAVDYYLDAKSQCAGVHGSCPDEKFVENTNSVRLLNAALVNGYSIVTYQRSLRASDELDLSVFTNQSQPIIWAIGPLNSRNEVSYHPHFLKTDKFFEFGRPPVWNCPMPEGEEEIPSSHGHAHDHSHHDHSTHDHSAHDHSHHSHDHHQHNKIKPNPVPTPKPVPKAVPWDIPAIQCYEPPDGVFYAQMGPTGGKQGYSAITGHVGWGISWYINGLLIPEINVVRGRKYTFVVEGGSDPEVPARYHPFYITNDPVGGYFHKTDEEKKGVKIYAGVRQNRNGVANPNGVGRLCNWTPDPKGPEADEYPSFGAYQRALTLVCEEGNPGVVTWVPDKNTPDTVYYQCFTHRHLGWKINVLDECDITESAESRVVERIALPDDMLSEESVQVPTRLTPDKNFLNERQKIQKIINTKTNSNNFSNYKGDTGLTGEVYPQSETPLPQEIELPISNGQIKQVIQTVETLEDLMKDDVKRNISQYQVHEDTKDAFASEQPIREDDEYSFEAGKVPESYFLPPNQKPLTLQSVLRPTTHNKPMGHMRPPYRRPVPPEIKQRRPSPSTGFPKGGSGGYPLHMPNHNNMYPPKKPMKFNPNRPTPNANRPAPNMNRPPPNMERVPLPPGRATPIPPMKIMPSHHQPKPNYSQITKLINKPPNSATQSIIMGKPGLSPPTLPSQAHSPTLNLGQTDIIASHVVKSQIMLPGGNDAVAQHSTIQTFMNKPGQIILGKPMDNPMPLDQQMIPTKQFGIQTASTPRSTYFRSTPRIIIQAESDQESQNEIKSSDFLGESADASSYKPAVNTGFKPDSIVVESGFKPIIREPLMASEDRIANDYENLGSNRREDTDVVEDYDESPQPINNPPAFSSEKLTETFEPMFIPSPEDHLLPTNDRTKEVFPTNHAKEDRPHPVYVKTEKELNALFSKKNIEKDVPSDLVMESDRISPSYLPPDPKFPKEHSQKLYSGQTFTTYDGKVVSGVTLTSVIENKPPRLFSSKLPANTEQLLKMPQFGPFKGEMPPNIDEHINTDTKASQDTRTTHLKLVNIQKPKETDQEAKTSEVVTELATTEKVEDYEDIEEYEEDEEDEDSKKRVKRDTKTTQFEKGEIQEVTQTNGHSKPVHHVEFETAAQTSSASNIRLYWMTHIVLLICMKLL